MKWEKLKMLERCEECENEIGIEDLFCLKCDLGYYHSICKDCMKAIKRKAKND